MHRGAYTIYNITLQTFNWSIILKILDNVIFLAWKLLISDSYFGRKKKIIENKQFSKKKHGYLIYTTLGFKAFKTFFSQTCLWLLAQMYFSNKKTAKHIETMIF